METTTADNNMGCGSSVLHFKEQDYSEIRKDLLKNKSNFEDDKFGLLNLPRSQAAIWLRPHEICESPVMGLRTRWVLGLEGQ